MQVRKQEEQQLKLADPGKLNPKWASSVGAILQYRASESQELEVWGEIKERTEV